MLAVVEYHMITYYNIDILQQVTTMLVWKRLQYKLKICLKKNNVVNIRVL